METIRKQWAPPVEIRGKPPIISVSNFKCDRVILMKNFSAWFRQAGSNLAGGVQRFMYGRYGHDKLNRVILTAGLVMSLVTLVMPFKLLGLALTLGAYGLLIWSLFRCFSRNHYKRYQENRRYLLMMDRIKDKQNRYFDCPKCHQTVRVPRGKGKIAITCPKCREKFVKKT